MFILKGLIITEKTQLLLDIRVTPGEVLVLAGAALPVEVGGMLLMAMEVNLSVEIKGEDSQESMKHTVQVQV